MPPIKLFCDLYHDPDEDEPFSVLIDDDETVDDLKDAIKRKIAPKLDNIPVNKLILYKVFIEKDQLKQVLQNLVLESDEAPRLHDPFLPLSEVFQPAELKPKHLHIIVKLPVTKPVGTLDGFTAEALEKQHQQSVLQGQNSPSPSKAAKMPGLIKEQNHRPIWNGRPAKCQGPPIEIFHPVFSQFQKDFADSTIIPMDDVSSNTDTYCASSIEFYADESKRQDEITPILAKLLGNVLESHRHRGMITDVTSGSWELKNEVGAGGSDPSIQAGMYYRNIWSKEDLSDIRHSCCCPAFLLAVAGPWICVLGAVFVEKVIVQPLTGYIWTGATTDNGLKSAERCFNALHRGLQTLKEFYNTLTINRNFKYTRRLYQTKPIFLAKTADGTALVVKFVEQYNEKAHKLLADMNLAPQLLNYFSDTTYWPFGVVVMEYVKGDTVHERYGATRTLPGAIYAQVKQAIEELHRNSIVFGDLRRPNIIITDDGKVKIIDFDWCGVDGKSRYPPGLNDLIGWHSEVKRYGIMSKAHDIHMLDTLHGPDEDVVMT